MPTTDFFKQCFAYVHNWASYLKIISRWLYLALFAGILSGCTQQDLNYVKYGVGVSVSDANIEEISSLQSQYFTSLCIAAVNSGSIDYSSQCPPAPGDERIWTLIVQQGLNDIDRRCDGYLEWLDIQRRRREPDLRMVNSVLGRTIAAIGLGWPSTVANPRPNTLLAINLVTQAFGLLTDGMENYHSRLLMAAEPSTISSVVFRGRDKFRQDTFDLVYTSRPAAEYALRRYLHICMPFTIEAQINDRTTQSTLGVTPNRKNSLLQTPKSVPILGAEPFRGDTGTNTTPNRPVVIVANGWEDVNTSGKLIDIAEAKAIQRALCFSPTKTSDKSPWADGDYGEQTEAGLKLFQTIYNSRLSNTEWAQSKVAITEMRREELLNSGSLDVDGNPKKCANDGGNYMESNMTSGRIVALANALGQTGKTKLSELRESIKKYRINNGISNGPGNMFSDQVTPELYKKLNIGSSS